MREAAAAMRATVVEREEIAAEIEHHDIAAADLDQLALAGRNLIDGGDDVACHQSRRYSARAFSQKIMLRVFSSSDGGKARNGSSKSQCG